MTQTNSPGEIKCPHCGQTYAISPQQWPQYQGRSIACTKCGQQFAVGMGAGGPASPPVLPPMGGQPMPGYPQPGYAQPGYPQQGYGFPPPPKKGMSGGVIALIVIACLALPCIALLIAILLPALNKVREEALKAKCASNLKNIAAAMITYSNTNNSQYPDSMVTLVRGSGMNTTLLVCPDSNDTPSTVSPSAFTTADMSGHCSYVYAAAGLTSNAAGPDDVLVYESGADHHGRGMNVLYGDYHVSWVNAAQAKTMIQQLSVPRPTLAPVGAP